MPVRSHQWDHADRFDAVVLVVGGACGSLRSPAVLASASGDVLNVSFVRRNTRAGRRGLTAGTMDADSDESFGILITGDGGAFTQWKDSVVGRRECEAWRLKLERICAEQGAQLDLCVAKALLLLALLRHAASARTLDVTQPSRCAVTLALRPHVHLGLDKRDTPSASAMTARARRTMMRAGSIARSLFMHTVSYL